MQNLINVAQKWITFTKLNELESTEYVNLKMKVILSEKANSVYFGYENSNFELLLRFEYYNVKDDIQTDVIIQTGINNLLNANFFNEIATRYSRILDVIEATKDKPLSFEPVGDYKQHLADATIKLKQAYDLQVKEKAKVELEQIRLSEQKAKEITIDKRTPKKTKKVEIKNLF